MNDNEHRNRWYDKDPRMARVLELVQSLSDEQQDELAENIIRFVNLIRENKKDDADPSLSIGKHRVLGLYKASSRRRWYDEHSSITSAMNVLATLPIEDCRNITEGILLTLEGQENSDRTNEKE